jgi:hypothetical protein
MDTAVTLDRRPDREQKITRSADPMSSPVQPDCPERGPFLTERRLAGGQAPHPGAPPGRREPVHRSGFEAEGKIEGTGTWPARRRVCTWGWRGTRRCTARCRNTSQRSADIEEIACAIRSAAIVLDGAES